MTSDAVVRKQLPPGSLYQTGAVSKPSHGAIGFVLAAYRPENKPERWSMFVIYVEQGRKPITTKCGSMPADHQNVIWAAS